MKSIALFLAFYMLLGSFFPQSDFGQLAKVSNILEHYRQHKNEAQLNSEQLSFTSFLKVHFITPDEHHQIPGHEHEGLPLHTVSHSSTFTLYPPALFSLAPLPSAVTDHQFFYLHSVLGNFSATIFHPPSFA